MQPVVDDDDDNVDCMYLYKRKVLRDFTTALISTEYIFPALSYFKAS